MIGNPKSPRHIRQVCHVHFSFRPPSGLPTTSKRCLRVTINCSSTYACSGVYVSTHTSMSALLDTHLQRIRRGEIRYWRTTSFKVVRPGSKHTMVAEPISLQTRIFLLADEVNKQTSHSTIDWLVLFVCDICTKTFKAIG